VIVLTRSKPQVDIPAVPSTAASPGAVVTPQTRAWLDQARASKPKFQLKRHDANPILSPNPKNDWESAVATNPAAWVDPETNDVVMLYRAAGKDPQHRVVLGMARSQDGVAFTRCSDKPVFEPSLDGFDAGCVEDPRVIRIDGWYYMTYAARATPPGQYWILPASKRPWTPEPFPDDMPWHVRENHTATGLAVTRDFKTFVRAGRLTNRTVDDRDVILFPEKINGRYYMLQRPMQWAGDGYGTEHPAMWISSGEDMLAMSEPQLLIKAKYDWETKVGGNTSPIRTEHGWLTLYHAVGPDKHYRLGALLLDLDNPAIVRYRTPDWIMQPEADYETQGLYNGCIFPCGKLVRDGKLMVYYGAGDIHVGLATCDFDALMAHMLSCPG